MSSHSPNGVAAVVPDAVAPVEPEGLGWLSFPESPPHAAMLGATASAKTIGSTKRNRVLTAISSDEASVGVGLGQATEEQQCGRVERDPHAWLDAAELLEDLGDDLLGSDLLQVVRALDHHLPGVR